MAVDQAFAELEDVLAALLPQVPAASDRVLAASAPRLRAGLWPERLALRALAFRWRCESRFEGAQTRFVLLPIGAASGRDMLDAELALSVCPVPRDEPLATPDGTPASVRLVLPRLVRWDFSPAALERLAPSGAEAARTLVLRLDETATLGVWSAAGEGDAQSDFGAETLRARWLDGGAEVACVAAGEWPVALFVAVAAALCTEASMRPGDATAFEDLDARRDIWKLARAGVALAASSARHLHAGESSPPVDPLLDALRVDWTVDRYALRAGALVNRRGRLAAAEEDDTFLVPFRVEWSRAAARPAVTVSLEPPDIAMRGALRACLLSRFAEETDFEALADTLVETVPGAALAADALRAWCDPARDETWVLRVDRTDDGERDAYLLVARGEVAGVRCAILLNARRVALSFALGEWTVADFDRPDVVFAGPVAGSTVAWERGVLPKRGRGRLLADVLSILLRWRSLLP